MPPREAVPLRLSMKETPPGRGPVSERVAAGKPVAVTVKVLRFRTVKVV